MKLSELKRIVESFSGDPTNIEQRNAHLKRLGLDPENLYQELEMESRYVDTHRDVTYNNSQVNLHSHDFCEVLYCINTCGVEYLVGTERYRLQRGDIVVVPPGMSHRPLLPEHMSEPYKRYVLWLSKEYLTEYLRTFTEEADLYRSYVGLLRTAGTKWESLGELFRAGVQEAEEKKLGWEISLYGNTALLLTQITRAVIERSTVPMHAEKPELLDAVLGYVEQHLDQKISLEVVAKQFWVSQSTISQTFRNKMGISFYHYVNQRRLIAAKTLIHQGTALESVGNQVGFADYSTFYRAFKKEYGISPRQFRKLQDRDEMYRSH